MDTNGDLHLGMVAQSIGPGTSILTGSREE